MLTWVCSKYCFIFKQKTKVDIQWIRFYQLYYSQESTAQKRISELSKRKKNETIFQNFDHILTFHSLDTDDSQSCSKSRRLWDRQVWCHASSLVWFVKGVGRGNQWHTWCDATSFFGTIWNSREKHFWWYTPHVLRVYSAVTVIVANGVSFFFLLNIEFSVSEVCHIWCRTVTVWPVRTCSSICFGR